MNYISCEDDHKRVLVTGFGPFSSNGIDIDINASGEAVKMLNKEDIEGRLNITLFTEEIPVEYKFVDEIVPEMWKKLQPDLTIHVGVSDVAEGFTLEKQAQKAGYTYKDSINDSPDGAENPCDGPDTLNTDLQVELIRKEFNCDLPEEAFKADESDDAGKYLCEYIYYTSLCQQQNENKTSLFVHVPPLELQDELEELARGLERILEICVAHVRMNDTRSYERLLSLEIESNGL